MVTMDPIERTLERAVGRLSGDGCPPALRDAIAYAVFPAGHRFRPRLTVAVADALGGADHSLMLSAAAAVELLHCASLVQDDLPSFDAADERRGRPALHRAFGEALAVLAADALIIGAFDLLGQAGVRHPERAARLVTEIARGVGSPHGAVAGQAWESESAIDLVQYHRTKTAALFESATAAGAIAAGHEAGPWRTVGYWLGRAYQIADDIADEGERALAGSDAALGRPNALRALGAHASAATLDRCIDRALEAIPPCGGQQRFRAMLEGILQQFRVQAARSRDLPRPAGHLARASA